MSGFKVSAGFGLQGMFVAVIALLIIGVGITLALGAIVLLSPQTAAVFILILFMVLQFFLGGEQYKTIIATACLFLILAILFGREIQNLFEAIPHLGIIFKSTVVIL